MNNIEIVSPDPWTISPKVRLLSYKDDYGLEYEDLGEWRMNSPLGGKVFLNEIKSKKRYTIFNQAGYPFVWQTDGNRLAIPLWIVRHAEDEDEGDVIFQRLGVVDADAKTLTIYSKQFKVVQVSLFDGDTIAGVDSPRYEPVSFNFDIKSEAVESVITLSIINQ